MHPAVMRPAAGSCPRCGMALVPAGAAVHTGAADCPHCLVNPRRSRSSLVAWLVALVAVAFALVVYFSRPGGVAGAFAGSGSLLLLALLLCPLTMGAMMLMNRKGH